MSPLFLVGRTLGQAAGLVLGAVSAVAFSDLGRGFVDGALGAPDSDDVTYTPTPVPSPFLPNLGPIRRVA